MQRSCSFHTLVYRVYAQHLVPNHRDGYHFVCVCVVVFIPDPYPKAKGVIESKHSARFVSPSSGRLFPVPFYVCYSLFHLLSMRFVRVVWAKNVGIPFPGKARDKPSGPLSAVYKGDTFPPEFCTEGGQTFVLTYCCLICLFPVTYSFLGIGKLSKFGTGNDPLILMLHSLSISLILLAIFSILRNFQMAQFHSKYHLYDQPKLSSYFRGQKLSSSHDNV